MSSYFGKFKILNIQISACDYTYILNIIDKSITSKITVLIAPIASHPIMLALSNSRYNKVLNSFNFVLPDSYYIKWALWFLYKVKIPSRLYGPDLFKFICLFAEKNNYSILLIGNHSLKLQNKLKRRYKKLRLDSIDLTGIEITNKTLITVTKDTKYNTCDIICIGIGTPSQHYLAYSLSSLKKPVVAVGAAFDFYSGQIPQGPEWLGKIGFEWLYRLLQEPKRLYKRYLYYGPLFILLILIQKLHLKSLLRLQ